MLAHQWMQLFNTSAAPQKVWLFTASISSVPRGHCRGWREWDHTGVEEQAASPSTNDFSQISKQRKMGVKMKAQRGEVVDPRSKQSSLPELETKLSWVHPWSSADTPSNFALSERNACFDSISLCTAIIVNLSRQISWSYIGYYFFTILRLSSRTALQMLFMIHLRSMINKT